MRALKLFAAITLLVASLGLVACTGTDISGTAGDLGGGENDPPPGAEQPPSQEGPGGADAGDMGGAGDVGGGADADDEDGDKQQSERQTLAYLQSLPPAQRLDFAFIEDDCQGCSDMMVFKDYVAAMCGAEPDACGQEFQTMLTKQRTATQIRNDQGLVGMPTVEQLLQVYDRMLAEAPAEGGDAVGGDTGAGAEGGSVGGDRAPGGGDEGDEAEEGDIDSPIALPAGPVSSAQAVLAALEGVKFDTLSLAELADYTDKDDLGALSSYFDAISLADAPLPGCESCLDTINVLLGGQAAKIGDLSDLLSAIVANG